MSPISVIREYIDEDIADILYGYIRRGENSDDVAERLNWEIRKPRFEYFIRNNRKSMKKVDNRHIRRLNYDMLPELLRIAELDGKGLFDLLEVPIPSLGIDYERLAYMLDNLPPDTVEQIKQTAFALSTDWWRSDEIMPLQPTLRIHRLLERKVPRFDRTATIPEGLRESWRDQHGHVTVPFRALPEISEYLGVSLHWLMRMSPDIGLYGENGSTDIILTAYCFMSKETKLEFLRAVIAAFHAQGKELACVRD